MRTSGEEIHLSSDNGTVTVEHSILTLDADSSALVNFVSSPGPAYLRGRVSGKQVLLSDEAYRILAPRFPQTPFLPCQYFRPISLGNLNVELVPSGESPGSSFLRVTKNVDTLLYASSWSRQTSGAFRKAVFKPASTLLVRLQSNPLAVAHTNARKETERLLEFAQKIVRAQENIVVAVGSFGEGQRLASKFHAAGLPVSCDAKLFRIMKTLADAIPHSEVPGWLRAVRKHGATLSGNEAPPSVVLVSKELLLRQRPRALPQGVWVWLGSDSLHGFRQPWMLGLTFVDSFGIHNTPDAPELLALVADVKPSQVLLYGEGAPQVVQWLAGKGVPAELFAPPRLQTLF